MEFYTGITKAGTSESIPRLQQIIRIVSASGSILNDLHKMIRQQCR